MTEIELRGGRRSATYTDLKDWVPLSGISVEAIALYQILRMHVNRQAADQKAKPTTDTIAAMMGRARGDKVTPWLRELVEIKAVEVERVGIPARNVYTVHEEPPPDHNGPLNLAEWYDANRDRLAANRATAKAKRDARREAKDQLSPVTPKSGEQAPPPPVTPISGALVDPDSGVLVDPESGGKPDVHQPDVHQPRTPSSRFERDVTGAGRSIEEEEEAGPKPTKTAPVPAPRPAEPAPVRPLPAARRLLTAVQHRGQVPGSRQLTGGQETTIAAALQAALEAGWTGSAIVETLAADPLTGAQSVFAVLQHRVRDRLAGPAPARSAGGRPPWCRECDEPTRRVEQPNPRGGSGVTLVPCPRCHPDTARQGVEHAHAG